VASTIGAPIFGLLLTEAESTGVDELGMVAFVAASALEEKGQNAPALCGRRVVAERIATRESMRNWWFDLMGI